MIVLFLNYVYIYIYIFFFFLRQNTKSIILNYRFNNNRYLSIIKKKSLNLIFFYFVIKDNNK